MPNYDLDKYYQTPTSTDEPTYDLSNYLEPEEPRTYTDDLADALKTSWKDAKAAGISTGVLTGMVDPETAAGTILESMRDRPTVPDYVQKYIAGIEAEGKDVSEAEGVLDTSMEFIDLMGSTFIESVKNPKATLYTIAQSAAHSIPSLTLGAAGALSPVPGGMAIGSGLGSFAIEAGAHMNQLLQERMTEKGRDLKSLTEQDIIDTLESDEFLDWARVESVKAGLSVAMTEALFAHAGSKIIRKGIDKAGVAGVDQTFKSKLARGTAAFGTEVAGEGTGEFVKQVATEGDVKFGDVALETVAGFGQSLGTTAIAQTLDQTRKAIAPRDKLDTLFGEGVDDIEGDALDNLNAAPDIEPTAEAVPERTPMDEVNDIIEQHGDLADAAAGLKAKGALDHTIPYEIFDISESTPYAMRTDGQKALLAFAREQDKKARTTAQDIGAAMAGETQVEDVAPEISQDQLDQLKFDTLSGVDKGLLSTADKIFLDAFGKQPAPAIITGEPTVTPKAKAQSIEDKRALEIEAKPGFKRTAEEMIFLKKLGERREKQATERVPEAVSPEAGRDTQARRDREAVEGEVPASVLPSGISEAAEPAPLDTVADIDVEIQRVTEATPKGIRAVRAKKASLKTLGKRREEAVKNEIDTQAQEAQTSPTNEMPEPSEAQIEAGNYKKGHIKVQGLDITVENPKGSERKGTDEQGKPWSVEMKDHYGYIKRTEGADGDHVDVFVGDNPASEKVFIVDQVNPATGAFDEHKVVMGANSLNQAKMVYNRNYSKGWKGAGAVTEMSTAEFKTWLKEGDTKAPVKLKEKVDGDGSIRQDVSSDLDDDMQRGVDIDRDISGFRGVRETLPSPDDVRAPTEIKAAPSRAPSTPTAKAKPHTVKLKPETVLKAVPSVEDTRGAGTQYHGTSSKIDLLQEGAYSSLNYYGQGFYTTDAKDIAEGYSKKGRGKSPTIYKVSKAKDLNIYDMEQTIPDNIKKMLGDVDESFISILEDPEITNLREAYDEFRVYDEFQSADEVQGVFESVTYNLEQMGYDGLRHIGGLRTGKAPHNVEIIFSPEKNISISEEGVAPTVEPEAVPTEDVTQAKEGNLTDADPTNTPAEELVPEPSTLDVSMKKGNPIETLRFILARTSNESYRAVIERILENVPMGLKLKTLAIGDKDPSKKGMQNARGLYSGDTNTIYIKDESFIENGVNEETFIHEMLHAVTMNLLATGNIAKNKGSDLTAAVKELYVLRDKVVKELNTRVKGGWNPPNDLLNLATQDVDEFISWGLTNHEFQDVLKSIPMKEGSVWNKFVKAIAKIFGIAEGDHNALSELMASVDRLLRADYRVDEEMRKQLNVVRESSGYRTLSSDIDKAEQLHELKAQAPLLEYDRDNKFDIAAGKNLKENLAEQERLQEAIQANRANDPHFVPGTDDIDRQGEELMGTPKSMMTLRERLKSFLEDKFAPMIRALPYSIGRSVSSAYVIEAKERELHGGRLPAEDSMTAAVHKSWNSKVAASMAIHQHGMKLENGELVPDATKPGLNQILEEVAKHGERYLRRFEQYLLLNRSRELLAQDRENFVTQDNIDLMDAWLDRNPNTKALFERQQDAFKTWNKGILDIAIASGWINEQDAYGGYLAFDADGNEIYNVDKKFFATEQDALDVEGAERAEEVDGWHSDMYVPFYRVADDSKPITPGASKRTVGDVRRATQKLKGGKGQIPILENIVRNAEFLINGSMRVQAMQKIEDTYKDTVLERIGGVEVPGLVSAAEMREEFQNLQDAQAESGEPVPELAPQDVKRWASLRAFAKPTDRNTVVVYREGRPTYYKVLDERLLTALKSIGAYRAKNWLNIIGTPTRILQSSITILPAFLARAFTRELSNAFIINSKGGANPLHTIGQGLKNFAKIARGNNAWMDEMMTGGYVNYNTYYKVTPDKLRKKLSRAGVTRSTFGKIVHAPWEGAKALGRAYMQIAIASEHAARRTVYDDFKKAGASEQEAKYQALDVMNFSRRSDFAAMEVLLATIPFLNPRIQGLDRLYRGAKEDWKPFALKAALMTASSMALAIWNWNENEEEMDKLKDEDKAMNYHFFLDTGGPEKEHWRIPKGFEVGQITGTLPEFFIEQAFARTPEPATKALRRFMTATFGLQTPQFLAPIKDLGFNEDSFRQRPIINYGQQFMLPPAQFDAWTSHLIKDIAQSMPEDAPTWFRSPKQLQYLFKGYTGPLGGMVLEGIDDIYRATGNAPDLPTKKLSERYVVRDFYRTGAVSSSKQLDLFYEMVQETGKLASTLKAAKDTDREEYRKVKVEHAEKLRIRSQLNKYSRRMSKFSSQIRKIMEDDTLTPDARARKKDTIIKRKNALAEKAVERYFHIFE